jgi:hypothetical protein
VILVSPLHVPVHLHELFPDRIRLRNMTFLHRWFTGRENKYQYNKNKPNHQ